MIGCANFFPRFPMDDLSKLIVGSSLYNIKLKFIKIDRYNGTLKYKSRLELKENSQTRFEAS